MRSCIVVGLVLSALLCAIFLIAAEYRVADSELEHAAASPTVEGAPLAASTDPAPRAPRDMRVAAGATRATSGSCLIVVRVYERAGNPLEGVPVTLTRYPTMRISGSEVVRTAQDGAATFTVRPGAYVAQALLADDTHIVRIAAGETRRVEIEVAQLRPLRVRVVDEGGAPIEGARIWMSIPAEHRVGAWIGETDASGFFEARSSGGAWRSSVAVAKEGYASSWTHRVDYLREDAPIVLARERYHLRGRVRTAGGTPCAGARVRLGPIRAISTAYTRGTETPRCLYAPPAQSAVTDAQGRFAFFDLPSHASRVVVRHAGFAETSQKVLIGRDDQVEVRMDRGASLAGTLFGADASPCSGGDLRLQLASDPAQGSSTRSDAQGRFAFDSLPGGVYDVVAAHGDTRARARVSLVAGARRSMTVHLRARLSVSGQVLGAASPAREERIRVVLIGRNSATRETLAGKRDRFEFADVAAGEYRVLAARRGELVASSPWIRAPRAQLGLRAGEQSKRIALNTAPRHVLPAGRFVLHYGKDYGRTRQSFATQRGSTVLLEDVRGRGPAELRFQRPGSEHQEPVCRFEIDASPLQQLRIPPVSTTRSVALVASAADRSWDTLRVLDRAGRLRFEAHVSRLDRDSEIPLPEGRGCLQTLHAGFVTAQCTFEAGTRFPRGFDPARHLEGVEFVEVELGGGRASRISPITVYGDDGWPRGVVQFEGASRALAMLRPGQRYRFGQGATTERFASHWRQRLLVLEAERQDG